MVPLCRMESREVSGYPGWREWTPPSEQPAAKAAKPSKYHAVKTLTADNILCDSKREAARWNHLRMMEKAGAITDLLPHPSFSLYVNGKKTGRMTFDALYVEHGRLVCEDTKSSITRKNTAYRQRLRTFEACYPLIEVREWLS